MYSGSLIKEPRDGGPSYGPGAAAALHPFRGFPAKYPESTLNPGTQRPRKSSKRVLGQPGFFQQSGQLEG